MSINNEGFQQNLWPANEQEDHIGQLLKKFVLTATALNSYLRCPLEFYYCNLLRLQGPTNDALEFGISVHFALERLFCKMRAEAAGSFPSKEEFIADFELCMNRRKQYFTIEQFDRRLTHGREILSSYYEKYIYSFNRIVAIERNIQNILIRDVPVKGKLDKLEFDGKKVNIVDYKTGDPDKAMLRLQPPNADNPNGGDYWRQAVFYKLLVDNYKEKGWRAMSMEFDFIEPDKNRNYRKEKLFISDADITTVTQQIISSWEKIQNRQFITGCGKESCYWCHYETQ